MPHPRLVRLCLLLLALTPLLVGAGALLRPHTFYGDFPPGSRHWVDRLGPYNEHMLTDFGGALLGQAALLLLAAWWLDRRVVIAALVASTIQSTAHFGYHLTTTSAYSTSDNVASIFGLALSVPTVLSVGLLAYTATATGSRPTAGSVAHSAPSQRSP
jgi:hypothetical protein